ncbi:acetoacetate--CoA ligase [Mycobacterium malmoense]|uniref:Acetoacetate--CoA ligase n=1 Tax=Mycobacterium malmoense TaxID=1780 RepID=A0ABX3SN73_MYCMA|nr:acetoacetate--CoA ligase [Mycobacterium malmoense]ORA78514.1 acetoacetate--CoA ligase [Mycobacterium malmoense]QZA18165.1 acetoacetate--CoA ligase [Mycobacterium malmoense]UNB94939.1 acetoacetate--CoA ligase [Mycobacterium malmoense]
MTEPGGWIPDEATLAEANLTRFMAWLDETGRGRFANYQALWAKSVDDIDWFWDAVWNYFDIRADSPPRAVLGNRSMPGAEWFPGARVNYAAEIFRHATDERPALIVVGEDGSTEWSWARLERETAAFAAYLRGVGVKPGDRVVGYLPNVAEAVVAALAAACVGAVWAVCNQDLAVDGVLARLGQVEPTVLVASDGSVYDGKRIDRREQLAEIRRAMPTLRATVVVPRLGLGLDGDAAPWAKAVQADAALDIAPVPFAHPLWVMFSSGTTGKPKGIVHGHGGVLLEHLKYLSLQLDLRPGDRFLWYSSTSWMMWNLLLSGLLVESTIVLYDGSPTHLGTDGLWRVAAEAGVTVFGAGAGYLLACAKKELKPGASYPLDTLRVVGSTGSPLPASGFRWVQEGLGRPVPVISMSGGTDVCTAFIGGCPILPVVPGELSCICLGAAVEAWSGPRNPVIGEEGELVLTKPMPSMPVSFWNDADGSRYRAAYFDKYPGVWWHGDWITITDRGSVVVHGRSDATLNRLGVRMGSAEIYTAVERMPEVRDCLVIGVEQDDGGYWMPLFVDLADGVELDDELRSRIVAEIRHHASPRHVPDDILQVPGMPRTLTGKRLEIPIKRILLGADPGEAVQQSSVDRPELLDAFVAYRRSRVP